MAYAALASFSQTINLILRHHKDSISPHFEYKIKSVHKSIDYLLGFLEDAPDKDRWLEERITEAIHESEDMVEILLSEQMYSSSVGPSRSKSNQGRYRRLRHGSHDMERITQKIESITEELRGEEDFLKDHLSEKWFELKIIDSLTGGPSNRKVIPIVGMPGIGKTYLARKVYENPLIMKNFDICGWATVTQVDGFAEMISKLLISIGGSDTGSIDFNFERVYKTLLGGRYLVVLDDVWDTEVWDYLERLFPDNGNGCRIIVTTRLLDVASYVDSFPPVNIHDEDQSWSLLRQKVFKGDHCPLNLKYVGKSIAESCRGLPLSIGLVSGILAADLTKDAWEGIAENLHPNYADDSESLNKILSMSYSHLPHYLRPCFLYMVAFPEDYEIRVSKLIKLWVAEGFLEPNELKSIEEIAEEYLEELVERYLVTVTRRKSDGRIKCVGIHDAVRDVCVREAEDEGFFRQATQSLEEGIQIPRRLSILRSCDLSLLENTYGSRIRSIICLENVALRCSFEYFRLLRILDLSNACTSFPAEIFQLFHLRYLAYDGLFDIPAAISNLRNLQTLIVSSSNYHEHFVELPEEIWTMPQLRHIVVLSCVVPSVEGATFAQENLLTLSKAVNLICSKELVKTIPNLKKLGLLYTVWRDYEDDYQLHNLIHLQTLEDLKIQVSNFPEKQRVTPAFPKTLKRLSLSGLGLPWNDMKIIGSLPNLEVLKLRDDACFGDRWETTKGEFPRLISLLIDQSSLKDWIIESSHFPKLKSLVLRRSWNLSEIPDEIGEIPTLELIEVDGKNNLLVDSAKRILEDQQSYGNDGLQIRILRNSEYDE